MGLTYKDYFKSYLQKLPIPSRCLEQIAKELSLDVENIFHDEIDYIALAAHYSRDEVYLPERYTTNAFSKAFTTNNFLDYINKRLGHEMEQFILNKLQVKRAALLNNSRPISIYLNLDLLSEMRDYANPEFFRNLGVHNAKNNIDSGIIETLSRSRSSSELHDQYISHVAPFYDSNYDHKILKSSRDYVVIEIKPKKDVADLFKKRALGNEEVCLLKTGHISTINGFIGYQRSHVVETKCIHRGDPSCIFHVSFFYVPMKRIV